MQKSEHVSKKTEKPCTVTDVDGTGQQPNWQCRCFDHGGGNHTHSYQGPGFSKWVSGGQGCTGNAHSVTNPDTGEQFCVTASC
jgi:hypothetical protein